VKEARVALRRVAPLTVECMKIKSAVFDVSAPNLESCPKWALPEFAFIGRSNVGKSSLINSSWNAVTWPRFR